MFFYFHNRKNLLRLLLNIVTLPTFWVSSSTVPLEYGEFKLFQTPVTYDLNTSVSITNEGGRTTGYRITAIVVVEPIWSNQETDFLLKFHLESPKLYIVGKKGEVPAGSSWDSLGESSFYARLTHGTVQDAYLDERDPLDLLNYKKSIVSLFQFRAIDGENTETDVSGLCDVVYQSTSLTTIHKTKTRCGSDEPVTWSRRAVYSLSRGLDALASVRAREHVTLGEHATLAARAEHSLVLQSADRQHAAVARDLAQALQTIPAHLKPVALTALQAEPTMWEWEEDLHSALAELRALSGADGEVGAGEEAAGAGGDEVTARAILRALPALAVANQSAVLAVLEDDLYYPVLPMLYRLVGQSGSGAGLAAAVSRLQPAGADPARGLTSHLLAGAARAPNPDRSARTQLLRLARGARDPAVSGAALLAVAAQARAHDDTRPAVRDLALKELAKCKDDSCRIVRLHALANLASPDTADVLLSHARTGSCGAALGALDALDALDTLQPSVLAALQDIAASGGRALEVRASALDIVLRRSPSPSLPAALPSLARALRPAPSELRRVFWQRVQQLEEDGADLERALRDVSPVDKSWHARANAGTSSVLSRGTGWQLSRRAARLHSSQVAAGGALRRGAVQLRLHAPGDARGEELLAVEVWTRGIESLAGGSEQELERLDEGPHAGAGLRGGLRVRVGGRHQPGVTLFDGQAELLGHIWAGAGSAPVAAARGARVTDLRSRAQLTLAGAPLAWRDVAVTTFAVDAQAQVSLWSRNARAALELRAAAASDSRLALAAPGGVRMALTAAASTAPRMTLDAHMDFYDGVSLCVRAALAAHRAHSNSTLAARGWRAARREARSHAGRTLALGADNDRACRDLAAEDHS